MLVHVFISRRKKDVNAINLRGLSLISKELLQGRNTVLKTGWYRMGHFLL